MPGAIDLWKAQVRGKMDKIRVLIVDDNLFYREGIAKVLQEADSIEYVGEATNGKEAIEKIKELKPEVVLMDLQMPVIGGVAATRQITIENPDVSIMMLTISDSHLDLIDAIKAGAIGYLLKDTSKEKLIEAIAAAYRKEAIISPSIAPSLLDEFKKLANVKSADEDKKTNTLTDREQEILKLMAEGLDNKAIAKTIFVSESTVKNHVSNILSKLQLQNRVQAGVLAAKEGLI